MDSRHADIAERGSRAVEALRGSAGWVERKLRSDGPELLDLASTPVRVRQQILDDLEKMARWLLVKPFWMKHIGKLIQEARVPRQGKPVRVLDVGAGHGGLLFAIGDWARKRRVPVELHGVEFDPKSVETARRVAFEEGRKVSFVVGDARALPFEAEGMDVVVTTFMLHHLPPGDVARVLAEMDRVAASNFFAFDVRRAFSVLPALWTFLRLGAFEAPTRHDAVVSLRRAYSTEEIRVLLAAGGVEQSAVKTVRPAYFIASRR
ncbi:MAG: methyltransferase domain-containing protein [Deltaproteobacteria bacterium]|nr:methyltransferase domain-containing protein [Deltaproteobacteria bacterium]